MPYCKVEGCRRLRRSDDRLFYLEHREEWREATKNLPVTYTEIDRAEWILAFCQNQ